LSAKYSVVSRSRRAASPAALGVVVVVGLVAALLPLTSRRAIADGTTSRHAPPPPLLMLFPDVPGDSDDLKALSSVRSALRSRSYFNVLTYDVESPAVVRAANEGHHQEWVDQPVRDDVQRLALARAIGADYYGVVDHPHRDRRADVRMVAVINPEHYWVAHDQADGVAQLLEGDAVAFVKSGQSVAQNVTLPAATQMPPPSPVVAATPPGAPSLTPNNRGSAPLAPNNGGNPVAVTPTAPAAPVAPVPVVALSAPAIAPKPAAVNPVVAAAPEVAAAPAATAPANSPPSPAVPVVSISPRAAAPTPVAVNPVVRSTPEVAAPFAAAPANPSPSHPAIAQAEAAHPTVVVTLGSVSAPTVSPTTQVAVSSPVVVAQIPDSNIAAPPPAIVPRPNPLIGKEGETEPSVSAVDGDTPATTPSPPTSQVSQDQIAEEMKQVRPMLLRGDAALDRGEIAEAIAEYRQAINGAPLSTVPRLKLAQAYLQGGFHDKAIDEAKRALEVAPDNIPVQEFLIHLDADESTSAGTVALYEALVDKNPSNPDAHIGLGDAYWNNDDLPRAEEEYKTAQHLLPPLDARAATQLARLYAVQSRYDDAADALKQVDLADRYPLAVRIIQMRSETLSTTLMSAREGFDAAKISHENFYDTIKKVSADAGALSDFIDKIKPPTEYRVSHLHRKLSADLIGQEADVLRSFIETSDSNLEDQAVKFEKSADTEMLTAHAAEEKQGLFHRSTAQP